jgi:hypothetical protein
MSKIMKALLPWLREQQAAETKLFKKGGKPLMLLLARVQMTGCSSTHGPC